MNDNVIAVVLLKLQCNICSCLSQVKSGTIFDNFLITDDVKEAEDIGNETWGATKVCWCWYFFKPHFTTHETSVASEGLNRLRDTVCDYLNFPHRNQRGK